MSTRISFSVPDNIGTTIDKKAKRAGYKSGPDFLKALTVYVSAALSRWDEQPKNIDEVMTAVIAELEA